MVRVTSVVCVKVPEAAEIVTGTLFDGAAWPLLPVVPHAPNSVPMASRNNKDARAA